jgi:exodeoxyribonuclease VII small subunit
MRLFKTGGAHLLIGSTKMSAEKMKKGQRPSLEKSLDALEKIVEQLESNNLDLESSLKLFEKGVALSRQCQQALLQIEQHIQLLVKEKNKETLTPVSL